jgi:hypothetical protein
MLQPVIKQVLTGMLLRSRPVRTVEAKKSGIMLLAIAGFLFAAAAVFLLIALYAWALGSFAPPLAALLTGLAAVFTGGIACAAGGHAMKAKAEPAPKADLQDLGLDKLDDAVMAVADILAEHLEQPIRENPKTSVALASLAGYLAAEKMH